jgi:hypothetical protein
LYYIVDIDTINKINDWLNSFVECPKLLEKINNIAKLNKNIYALATFKTTMEQSYKPQLYGFHIKLFEKTNKLKDIRSDIISIVNKLTKSQNECLKLNQIYNNSNFNESYITWFSVGKCNNQVNVNVYYKNLCDDCEKLVL